MSEVPGDFFKDCGCGCDLEVTLEGHGTRTDAQERLTQTFGHAFGAMVSRPRQRAVPVWWRVVMPPVGGPKGCRLAERSASRDTPLTRTRTTLSTAQASDASSAGSSSPSNPLGYTASPPAAHKVTSGPAGAHAPLLLPRVPPAGRALSLLRHPLPRTHSLYRAGFGRKLRRFLLSIESACIHRLASCGSQGNKRAGWGSRTVAPFPSPPLLRLFRLAVLFRPLPGFLRSPLPSLRRSGTESIAVDLKISQRPSRRARGILLPGARAASAVRRSALLLLRRALPPRASSAAQPTMLVLLRR